MNWETVCFSLRKGGLGIENLRNCNNALLGKWLRRFLVERNALWRKVVVNKFGEGNHYWFLKEVLTSHGLSVWNGIMKGWDTFKQFISFDVGSGNHIRFWRDIWCGNVEFQRMFPNLFNLAVSGEELVSSLLVNSGGIDTWNPTFRRDFQDWEIDEVAQFFVILYA